MVPPCQALSCHSFQFFTPYETDTSLRRCLSPSRVISITRLNHSFKHFSFVILLFHFLMISLLLLDVGLSCFVCLVQVITDRARAVEGKFFLSFHLSPPPPRPPFSIHYCPRHLRFASHRNSLLLKIQSPPPPTPLLAKSKVKIAPVVFGFIGCIENDLWGLYSRFIHTEIIKDRQRMCLFSSKLHFLYSHL